MLPTFSFTASLDDTIASSSTETTPRDTSTLTSHTHTPETSTRHVKREDDENEMMHDHDDEHDDERDEDEISMNDTKLRISTDTSTHVTPTTSPSEYKILLVHNTDTKPLRVNINTSLTQGLLPEIKTMFLGLSPLSLIRLSYTDPSTHTLIYIETQRDWIEFYKSVIEWDTYDRLTSHDDTQRYRDMKQWKPMVNIIDISPPKIHGRYLKGIWSTRPQSPTSSEPPPETSIKRARTSISAPPSPTFTKSAFSSTPASSPPSTLHTLDHRRVTTPTDIKDVSRKRSHPHPLTPHATSHSLIHPNLSLSHTNPHSLSHTNTHTLSHDKREITIPYDEFNRLSYIDQLRFRSLDDCRLEWIDGGWMIVGKDVEEKHDFTTTTAQSHPIHLQPLTSSRSMSFTQPMKPLVHPHFAAMHMKHLMTSTSTSALHHPVATKAATSSTSSPSSTSHQHNTTSLPHISPHPHISPPPQISPSSSSSTSQPLQSMKRCDLVTLMRQYQSECDGLGNKQVFEKLLEEAKGMGMTFGKTTFRLAKHDVYWVVMGDGKLSVCARCKANQKYDKTCDHHK